MTPGVTYSIIRVEDHEWKATPGELVTGSQARLAASNDDRLKLLSVRSTLHVLLPTSAWPTRRDSCGRVAHVGPARC
jgi:hypothetical protein